MLPIPGQLKAWIPQLRELCTSRSLNFQLTLALVWQESAGNPRAYKYEKDFWDNYLSTKPAYTRTLTGDALLMWKTRASASYGLFQVMFPVAVDLGLPVASEPEILFCPPTNIHFGTLKLSECFKEVSGDPRGALLRYNGGSNQTYPEQVLEKATALDQAGFR